MDYLAKGVVFWLSVYLYAGQILVDSLSPVPLSRVSAGKFPDGDVLEPVTTAISTGGFWVASLLYSIYNPLISSRTHRAIIAVSE